MPLARRSSSHEFRDADATLNGSEVDARLDSRVLVGTEPTPTSPVPSPDSPDPIAFRHATSRLNVRLANSSGQRSDASYLVRKMYGWRGYAANDAVAHDPNCVTLVASDGEEPLATITVGFDSAAGMAVGSLYPEIVSSLRERGAQLCEFTRLAVDRTAQSRELLAMLFHVAYIYARRIHSRSDLLIEVNPRHGRFYERMLGFRSIGPERMCPRVNAPAVLMWLPLAHAEAEIARHGGHAELAREVRSLYPLFFSPGEEAGLTARLRALG